MLQSTATQHLGRMGVLNVAILFAVLHFGYRSVLNVLFVFAVALLFGLIAQRSGTLLGVSISHGLTNVSLYLVFPFLFAGSMNSISPPTELLLPQVATPTPFQNISPTPRDFSTPALPYPSQNILESTIQDGSQLDSTEVIPSQLAVSLTQCGSPQGWVGYIVQSGDTLWGISIRVGESVEAMRKANCLENDPLIYIGQRLFVPHLLRDAAPAYTTTSAPPTQIPTLKPTQTQKPTEKPSPTPPNPLHCRHQKHLEPPPPWRRLPFPQVRDNHTSRDRNTFIL